MPRLPKPGGDAGSWGEILNDFLSQEHESDGTLKRGAEIDAKYEKPNGGIPKTDLDAVAQSSLDKADNANTYTDAKTGPLTPGPGQIVVGGPNGPMSVRHGLPGVQTIALGDSITAANTTTGQPGGDSFATLAEIVSNGRLRLLRNAGVWGDTTAMMPARVGPDVVAYAPDRCLVLGGTNDLPGANLSQTIANLEAIWDTLLADNIAPVACLLPPRDTAAAGLIPKWNRVIRARAEKRGLPVVDWYDVLVNPATGHYQTALTTDGTHPNGAGAALMAQRLVDTVIPLYPPTATAVAQDNTTGLLANGLFLTDTNSDGVADSWSLDGTGGAVSPTLLTGDTSILGNWQVLTQAANGQRYLRQTVPAANGFAVGGTLEFSGCVATESMAMKIRIRIDKNTAGSAIAHAVYDLGANVRGRFRCTFVVPADGTTLYPNILTGATGTGVVKLAQLSLRNLTALGLA